MHGIAEQHRIAPAAGDPLLDRRAPVAFERVDPAHQHLAEAAGLEVRGQLAHDALGERVSAEPAVAVDDVRLRRDDVRRVADDEVEALARDRLEQVALAQVELVQAVEHRVEAGEAERPRVDVDAGDVPSVPRGEQGLLAVARCRGRAPARRACARSARRAPGPAARRRARGRAGSAPSGTRRRRSAGPRWARARSAPSPRRRGARARPSSRAARAVDRRGRPRRRRPKPRGRAERA